MFTNLTLSAVLTKFFVYAGIAIIACEMMPVMFNVLGWGVRSWPVNEYLQ